MTNEPVGTQGVGRIDAAVEELRHATYGMFGPALRTRFLDTLGWELSPIHYRALRIVEGTDPLRPTMSEVAAALLVDKSRASRLVGQLRDAGLVTNAVGRLDRRRREIELADTGREVLAEARRVRVEFLGRALDDWSDTDVDALAGLIERFNASIRNIAW